MPPFEVNWLAVIIGVVAMQVIGFLWYGPLFGKLWMTSVGKTPDQMESPAPAIAVGVVANLVAAIVLAWLLNTATVLDVPTGIYYGLFVAVGFVVTTSAVQGAYESKNLTTSLLYIAYNLVAYAALGGVLGYFG